MNKYKVYIKETLIKTIEIEAKTIEDAIEQAEDQYYNCDIILTADDFSDALIQAESEDGEESTQWDRL